MEKFAGKRLLECSKLLNAKVPKYITTVNHEGRVALDLYLQVWSIPEKKGFGVFETTEH
jgi:hypothetical protein